jgi:TonB family protein
VSLVTVVAIRIAEDGEIEQSWIEERSGNEYYDQSALRAIRKANPLPPLPKDLRGKPLEVGINFRYPE